MNSSWVKSPWFWSLIAIVIVLVIVLVVWQEKYNGMSLTKTNIASSTKPVIAPLPSDYKTAAAAVGQYPPQLPKAFILYPKSIPLRGEVTTPPGGVTHVITDFTVSDSLAQVFNNYRDTLTAQGWLVTASSVTDKMMYLQFIKANQSLEVTITPTDIGTQVQLDYVANNK